MLYCSASENPWLLSVTLYTVHLSSGGARLMASVPGPVAGDLLLACCWLRFCTLHVDLNPQTRDEDLLVRTQRYFEVTSGILGVSCPNHMA